MTERGTPHPNGEDWLTQVLVDGRWLDYVRSTEAQARAFFTTSEVVREPDKWRCVDWIRKDTVLIAPVSTRNCRGCGTPVAVTYGELCPSCERWLAQTQCPDPTCRCPMPGDTVHLHDSPTRVIALCGAVDRPQANHPRVMSDRPMTPAPLTACAACVEAAGP